MTPPRCPMKRCPAEIILSLDTRSKACKTMNVCRVILILCGEMDGCHLRLADGIVDVGTMVHQASDCINVPGLCCEKDWLCIDIIGNIERCVMLKQQSNRSAIGQSAGTVTLSLHNARFRSTPLYRKAMNLSGSTTVLVTMTLEEHQREFLY